MHSEPLSLSLIFSLSLSLSPSLSLSLYIYIYIYTIPPHLLTLFSLPTYPLPTHALTPHSLLVILLSSLSVSLSLSLYSRSRCLSVSVSLLSLSLSLLCLSSPRLSVSHTMPRGSCLSPPPCLFLPHTLSPFLSSSIFFRLSVTSLPLSSPPSMFTCEKHNSFPVLPNYLYAIFKFSPSPFVHLTLLPFSSLTNKLPKICQGPEPAVPTPFSGC